ncbi:MAG TPA: ABC transporter permease [Chitinophagaceae bacterium]|nr:ABC transporter permease [Chitinophagaceae bacterium]
MIRNLLITAFRNLRKNKFFSALNILGLGIGMAVFLLIAQYVHFEKSYENFVADREDIYRVKLEAYKGNELVMASAENYPGVGPALVTELPDVMSYARLYNMGYKNNVVITNENAKPDPIAFRQRRFLYADSTFLPMMGYQMLRGDAKAALKDPFTAVISEKYAKMYFLNEDPIGKMLRLKDDDFTDELVKVTGVFKDIPSNTHLKFDVLFSYNTLYPRGDWAISRYRNGWRRKDMYTFVQLRPGTDPRKIEARLPAIVDKYAPGLKESQEKQKLGLQALKDIHLHSDLTEEPEANGDARTVFFLGLIGIFVLVIAWINYINLSTARALERAKEVGIRKVVGAVKGQLIGQFLTEAALVNLVSVVIAWGLAVLFLSSFNTLSGLQLTSSYLVQPWFLLLLGGLWIGGSLLSGFYPAVVLSSFRPITVLKGKLKNNTRGILLRKGLVIMQFAASIALIAGTLIVYRQVKYMTSRNLGMNIDQVLVIERPGIADTSRTVFNSSIETFKNELKKDPSVQQSSASFTIPGKQREYKVVIKRLGDNTDSTTVRFNSMDYDFIDVFKMKLLAGRNFSKEFPKDPDTSIIITQKAAELLGFKKPHEAVGQTLIIPQFGGWKPIIVGVVNDYHQLSMKKPLDPSILVCSVYGGEYYSLRVNTSNLPQTLKNVQRSWTTAFPGNPFEYFFLDDYFNKQYENERKFEKLFFVFAALAIIIGCLGLFGLSAYMATQRIKEIGIRKVLGASVQDITKMLSKDFLRLVVVAIVIASPVAWWAMNKWLQDFAYRVNISWWIFAVAGFAAILIAMLTVSFQALKAAIANPVKSLRTE